MLKLNITFVARFVLVLMLFAVVGWVAYGLSHFDSYWNYKSWMLTDLLINYEGGFVRRGLTGQLFFLLYEWNLYPVRDVMFVVLCATAIALLVLLVRIFRKEGWSMMLLGAPFLLITPIICQGQLLWCRRDAFCLLCVYAIFCLYKRYIDKNSVFALVVMFIVSVMTIFMYEPMFVFAFPLLFLFHLTRVYTKTRSVVKALFSSALLVLPAFIAALVVSLHKGTPEIQNAIWQSWGPCMERYPLPTVGYPVASLEALTWDTVYAVNKHVEFNFLRRFWGPIPSLPVTCLAYGLIYYLVTRINVVDLKINKLKEADRSQLSNFIMVQFVCMLPMLTVLSCDMGRVVPIWVISSLLACHVLRKWECEPLTCFSDYIQQKMDRWAIFSNPYFYLLIMLTVPVCTVGGAVAQNLYRLVYPMP